MAYTIDEFPFSTDNPQIEVTLPVGTHVLELVVEDSAGLRSLPDTVVVTVEREEIPNASILSIEPASGLVGRTISAFISGTGLSQATGVTFYRQTTVTRPTVPTLTRPTIISPLLRLSIPDTTITAEITQRSETGIAVSISIDSTADTGTRTFSVTTPNGNVSGGTLAFNVIRLLPTPTITIPTTPTITRPTLTIPTTPTLTRPTLTIPTLTIPTTPTLTRPTLTIPTLTIPTTPTLTRPTLTIPTATIPTLTRPTATIPTVTMPTATLTIPTATIPTVTRPTATIIIPTATIPTVVIPTATIPTIVVPTATVIMREAVTLTAVKGIGAASADKLTAAGIASVAALASSNAKDVAKALGYQDITRAQTLVDEAKKLLG